MRLLSLLCSATIALGATPLTAQRAATAIDLPWQRAMLPNGLTLLMQPDSSVSSVAVQVWMRGGAREEAPGQYGIAHLFEHDIPYSERFFTADNSRLRARTQTGSGAGTDYDLVRFYGDVQPEGLEALLGNFADRMVSDSAKFTAERVRRDQDIVVSELRRALNIDWNVDVSNRLALGTFGADHPYNHAISGWESDVRAATPALMQDWHRRFAGASNMLVIVVGNFDAKAATEMVQRQFGGLTPGLPLPRVARWIPRPVERRDIVEKDIARAVVYMRWPIPEWGDLSNADLCLLAQIINERQRALPRGGALDSLTASVELMEVAGAFTLRGLAAEGARPDSAEAQMRRIFSAIVRDGPTAVELARAKAIDATTFALLLQQLGERRNGRADAIGLGQYFRNDPDRWRAIRGHADAATPAGVREVTRRWLGEPGYVLHVIPRPTPTSTAGYDRSTTVAAAPVRRAAAPPIVDRTLASGLRAILVERPALPLAQITLAFGAGSGTDTPETAGRARVALDALMRLPVDAAGTTLEEALSRLGARAETSLDRDYAIVSIASLSDRLSPTLTLLAAALTRPAPEALLRTSTADAQTRLRSTLANPSLNRRRVLGCLMIDPCDPQAIDGLGTAAGLARLSPAGLRAFYAERYRPANALLIVSGRVEPASLDLQLATSFARRSGGTSGPAPGSTPALRFASAGTAAVIDFPSATQTFVALAQPLPPEVASDPAKLRLARYVNLAFRQRLMANLRESKGWSYEVYPFTVETSRGGAFMLYNIPLQPDKVAEAIAEIGREMAKLRDDTVSAAVLAAVQAAGTSAAVPRDLSSLERINAELLEVARTGLTAADFVAAQRTLGSMTREQLRETFRAMLDPTKQFWVLAGRAESIRAELAEAGITPAQVQAEASP